MMQKRFGLLGLPLCHSLSPYIHQLFARQFSLQITYALQEVKPDALQATLDTFFAAGGSGLNITAPYKEQIYNLLPNLDSTARTARAVNTVYVTSSSELCGANTDGIGLLRDVVRHKLEIADRDILILGAGGAVRGILPALLSLQPNSITLVNRTIKRAELLATEFAVKNKVKVQKQTNVSMLTPHIIINAISSNLGANQRSLYAELNFKNTICYDLNYGDNATIFLTSAVEGNASKTVDGLGVLVEQAAAAFKLWHNCMPQTTVVLAQLQQFAFKKTNLADIYAL